MTDDVYTTGDSGQRWLEDDINSYKSQVKELREKGREWSRGQLGGYFKIAGQALQAPIALIQNQEHQKMLQPIVVLTQLAAGIFGNIAGMAQKNRLNTKLSDAEDTLDSLLKRQQAFDQQGAENQEGGESPALDGSTVALIAGEVTEVESRIPKVTRKTGGPGSGSGMG